MKKLLLISILALNYNVVQAAVDIDKEFTDAPAPKNDAEVLYEERIKGTTAIRLLAVTAVLCRYRDQDYLIVLSNAILRTNTGLMMTLLNDSPSSKEWMNKVNDISEKVAINPNLSQSDCLAFQNGPMQSIDKIYSRIMFN